MKPRFHEEHGHSESVKIKKFSVLSVIKFNKKNVFQQAAAYRTKCGKTAGEHEVVSPVACKNHINILFLQTKTHVKPCGRLRHRPTGSPAKIKNTAI